MATLDRNGNAIGEATNAIKAPCSAATTGANIALTGVQTIDGVTVGNNGERVLVKDQTVASQNGIYVASTGTWNYATDYNSNNANSTGTQVYIAGGAINGGQTFVNLCTDNPIVIGTSACTFAAVSTYSQQGATSTTSATIGTGAKTFTVQSGKAFAANEWVVIYQTANSANAMLAQITSYSGTSLVVNVTATGGSGTFSAWTIVLANSPAGAGITPPVGSGNVTGPGSSVAGHIVTFADSSGKVLADGGITGQNVGAATLLQSAVALGFNMLNGQFSVSASAGALTISVLTLAGAVPSAADPVWFMFRSATATNGTPVFVQVTSALTTTIPSGSTLGFSTNTPGRAWITAVNNAGTVSLAVINCLSMTLSGTVPTAVSIYPLGGWGIANVTAYGGGANNAQVLYGTGALASVPYSTIGFLTWETGNNMTAGTWVAPSRAVVRTPDVPLPGQPLNVQWATNATGDSTSSGSFVQFTHTTVSITPTSSANIIEVGVEGPYSVGTVQNNFTLAVARGSTSLAALVQGQNPVSGLTAGGSLNLNNFDFPATLSATSYNVYASTGASTTFTFPSSYKSAMAARELMA